MRLTEKHRDIAVTAGILRSEGKITIEGKFTKIPTDFFENLVSIASFASNLNQSIHSGKAMKIAKKSGNIEVSMDFLGNGDIVGQGETLLEAISNAFEQANNIRDKFLI